MSTLKKGLIGIAAVVSLFAASDQAFALSQCRWTGEGADNKWSTAANWTACNGGHPQNGDDVTFVNGAKQPANQNDIAGLSLGSVAVVGRGVGPAFQRWNITGLGVTITSRVLGEELLADNGGNNPSFQVPITLGQAVTVSNDTINQGATSASLVLGAVDLNGFHLLVDTKFAVAIGGTLSGSGRLRKVGPSSLTLHDNSYTGVTDIVEGTVFAAASSALGAGGVTNSTTIDVDGKLILFDGVVVSENVLLVNGTLGVPGGASATFAGPIIVPSTLNGRLNTIGALTVTGPITASGGTVIFAFGGGPLTVSNPSNNWPSFFLQDGTLRVGAQGALPGAGQLRLALGAPVATLDLNNVDVSIGALSGAEGGRILLGSRTLTINQTVDGTYSGTIAGVGNVVKTGPGVLALAGPPANTYNRIVINNGTLAETSFNEIPDGAQVTVTAPGLLDLRGHNDTIGSLTGNGQITLGKGSLAIGLDNTSTTFDGVINGDSAPAGLPTETYFRIVKLGTGTLTLTGNSRLTDQLVVHEGTLVLDGKVNGSGVLLTGGVLGGSGTIFSSNGINTFVSNLVSRGGAVSPGHSPGILHADAADIGQGGSLVVQLNGLAPGSGYDQLDLTSNLTLAATPLVVTRGFAPAKGAAFTIVKLAAGMSVGGTFAGLPEGGTIEIDGQEFSITYRGGENGNAVVLTALEGPPAITYFLSEGATGDFFDEDVLVANPNDTAAPVTLTFSKENGEQVVATRSVPARSRLTVHVDEIPGLEATAASTQVKSDAGVPLVVERSMFWDKTRYAGHTGSAVAQPGPDWFFAEGSQGFFETFVLVINPNATPADVTFTFFRENEPPVVKTKTVGASTRLTLHAGDFPELVTRSFGISVHATQPIMAERSMYFGTTSSRLWSGGSESAGVTAASTHWFLAEGATGGFFDTFVLLSNPQGTVAHVTLQYLLDTGDTITVPKTIAANARLTTSIEAEADPRLHNAAVSTVVTSDVPILAERSMYWLGAAKPWGEGHNSFGVVDAGTTWGLAEGRVGGARNYHTYILLANPETTAASVTVSYLRENGAPVVKTYTVPPTSRFNIDTTSVTELHDESFGAVIAVTNNVPIIVERSMYWDSNGFSFSGGTNATGIRLP
jgi:autotransporter-associated beta strand protein